MFYKWGISTSHGHNQGCKDSYSSILTRRRTWTIERRVFIFMVIIMCLWKTKRNRIWTMRRFLFYIFCCYHHMSLNDKKKKIQTINRRVAYPWLSLYFLEKNNNTNNKEEGCAKEDLQLSRFSNFSFTFHQPSFLSSFLLLFLVSVSSLLLLLLPVFFQWIPCVSLSKKKLNWLSIFTGRSYYCYYACF